MIGFLLVQIDVDCYNKVDKSFSTPININYISPALMLIIQRSFFHFTQLVNLGGKVLL